MNLFLAPVTRALGRQITQTHVWVNPYLVNCEHRLEHIDGALLGGEVGECVAIFGGGGHQARSVLKEELDKVGVVVLCGEMDRLLVQVVVGVDRRLKKVLPIQITARDGHEVSVYAYSFGYVHLQLMRIGFPHPHETKMKSPKIVIFGGYYLAKICKFWAINTISDTQYHFWAKTR